MGGSGMGWSLETVSWHGRGSVLPSQRVPERGAGARVLPDEPLCSPAACKTARAETGKEGEQPGESLGWGQEGEIGMGMCPGQDPPAWGRSLVLGHGQGCAAGSASCPALARLCRTVLAAPLPAPLLPPLPRAPSTSEDGAGQVPPHQADGSCSPCPCQGQTSPRAGEQVRHRRPCRGLWGRHDAPSAGVVLMSLLCPRSGAGVSPGRAEHCLAVPLDHLCRPQAQRPPALRLGRPGVGQS